MIDRQEILELAREFSLRPDVVEKDYALGWLLAGIGQHIDIGRTWAFKGGTCLKKCFFETYRFSEDLDFTLLDADHLNEQFLSRVFGEIAEWIYEQSGLELPKENFKFELYQNPRGKISVLGRVGYRGPIAPRGDLPRIKLDLTNDEYLALPPVQKKIHHAFSDFPADGFEILCYPYEEVFAEKIRALSERELPRDLYDVVHLYRHPEMRPDRESILKILREKCQFKKIPIPTFEALKKEPQRTELEQEWAHMLAHQLPALPSFEQFWSELPQIFGWLGGATTPAPLQPIGTPADEEIRWSPPAMAQAWGMSVPLEAIRFAGANRLCVNLGYKNTKRIIEPYSLRQTKDGTLLLHAIRVDNREHRSYKVNEIESAEVTQMAFTPAYAIELSPTGPIQAPLQSRSASLTRWTRHISSSRRTGSSGSTLRCIIECTRCGKRFTRVKMDTNLKDHKDKNGSPCHGRYGRYVETKY